MWWVKINIFSSSCRSSAIHNYTEELWYTCSAWWANWWANYRATYGATRVQQEATVCDTHQENPRNYHSRGVQEVLRSRRDDYSMPSRQNSLDRTGLLLCESLFYLDYSILMACRSLTKCQCKPDNLIIIKLSFPFQNAIIYNASSMTLSQSNIWSNLDRSLEAADHWSNVWSCMWRHKLSH